MIHTRNCRTLIQHRKSGWKTTSLRIPQNFNFKMSSEHRSCLAEMRFSIKLFEAVRKQKPPSLYILQHYYRHTLSYFLQHSALHLPESSTIQDYKFLVRLKAPNLLQTIYNFILFCFPCLQWRCGSMTLCYYRRNIPVAQFLLVLATILQKQRCSWKPILWCIVTLCKNSQLLEILSWRAVL